MSVVSGWDHTLFVDENGSLWGMGHNGNSRLGVGNHEVFQLSPVKIIDENVTAVATGDTIADSKKGWISLGYGI